MKAVPDSESKHAKVRLDESESFGKYQSDNRSGFQNHVQQLVDDSSRVRQLKTLQRVLQRKRKRQTDDDETAQAKKNTLQRVATVKDIGKRVVIDNPDASDFGDTGKLVRKSRNVRDCLVVEFDNERGVEYRVWPHEMSALGELNEEAAVGSEKFLKVAKHGPSGVIIVGEVDFTRDQQTAEFRAYYQGKLAGKLDLAVYPNPLKVYVTDVYTYKVLPGLGGPHRIKGMGVALLQISAIMAARFNIDELTLAATKVDDRHPGTFYEKFGFKSREDLSSWGGSLAKYIAAIKAQPVNMDATPTSVTDKTQPYLTSENWTFGGWNRI